MCASSSTPDPFTIDGLFHVGVTVSDMERALEFYRDALGLQVRSDGVRAGESVEPVVGVRPESMRSVFLSIPGSTTMLELFEYRGIDREPNRMRPCDTGFAHFCLYVPDLQAVWERVTGLGHRSIRAPFRVTSGPHTGAMAVYLLDPDGFAVELYQVGPAGPTPG